MLNQSLDIYLQWILASFLFSNKLLFKKYSFNLKVNPSQLEYSNIQIQRNVKETLNVNLFILPMHESNQN